MNYTDRIIHRAQAVYDRAMSMVSADDIEDIAFLQEMQEVMNLVPREISGEADADISDTDIFGDDMDDMNAVYIDRTQNPFRNEQAHEFFDRLTALRRKLKF